ncbi:helix-turn-helix domain-containing protein [Massilia sp. Root351]|jgi:transcriptional regulator with XRE-family HTH domain|uniref:helix-turn-helix domain-containing protein n=1 Tax=Massilia sp. Root351 TaxID=1736522 RepID=UPI00070DC9AE|nr:helix-turn-helix transcriptional regulator [Massilia sp. Root351]
MNNSTFGEHLRVWRKLRHLSQQGLAESADLSARHLSFLETGRSSPSREMVLRLSDRLNIPPRERNNILEAAGFAPMYKTSALDAPEMRAARHSLNIVLKSHMPNPCLVMNGRYEIVAMNQAVGVLLSGAHPALLAEPVNVVKFSLHPDGLGSSIINYPQWRTHILERLARQLESGGDSHLRSLIAEVRDYPFPALRDNRSGKEYDAPGVLLPLRLRSASGILSFISTVTIFGTPHDITLQELAIETFFPADDFTAAVLARRSADASTSCPIPA